MNNVDMKSSLWIYAVHSRNPDLIHLLEEYKIQPPNDSYFKCLKESMKCHHNEFVDYIQNNLIDSNLILQSNNSYKNNIFSYSVHYHNYAYLLTNLKRRFAFNYLCKYNYIDLVKYFIKSKEIDINYKIKAANYESPLKLAAKKNNMEIVNLLLSQPNCSIGANSFQKSYAFHECKNLTSITIPTSVKWIGSHAFGKCISLKEIELPSSMTSVGSFTFSGCSSLTQITIPSSIKAIDSYAFCGCSSLTRITLPSTINTFESHIFSGCSSLQEITIPQTVNSIEPFTFDGCKSLKQISLPSSVTRIGIGAFRNCSSLKEIALPSSITKIEGSSFCGCISLETVNVPDSVIELGSNSFRECKSLKENGMS
ncbi:hypothetical protein M9Y10_043072 [Tritrichomonas musculus]|uniref:Uncharacterized protein n=1 Tax=Tritrichomonas musculus TaxID=1915356 RepID=A0ABR2K1L1_9EUKA